MILQSLHDLYDRLAKDETTGITPLRFAPQKVSFRVTLKPNGDLFAIAPVIDTHAKKNFMPMGVPEHAVRAGTKILPQFLCDKITYCLGIDPKTGKREGCEDHFEKFKEFHLAAESEIQSEAYSTFCQFLKNWNTEKAETFAATNPELLAQCINFGIFEIQGQTRPLHEIESARNWWIDKKPDEAPLGQCLITGETDKPISRLHPKIKGFASASSLVGVQKNTSYESYNLEQAFTSPTSELAAFKYASALNWMLDGKGRSKHRFYLGDTTCVFWTSKPSVIEQAVPSFFSSGSNASEAAQNEDQRLKIEIFLKLLRQGKEVFRDLDEDPDQTDFFILGLEQPNPGRLAIRFFLQSTVTDFVERLRAHHSDISIVREYEVSTTKGMEQPEFPGNKDLINQTAVKLSSGKLDYKTIPPLLGGALMRSILENTRYPEGLYSAVIRRIHADRTINYFRAAILKGTLTRNHKQPIKTMLDPDNPEPAYLLGRLFAALEKIEEEGHYAQTNSKRESTIREKYFSSACATPAAVFPRLETLSTHHRRHLNPGRKTQFDKLIADIKWNQSGTKSSHTLQEQGQFILGYYHQRKDLFTTKKDNPATTEA
jgi:CRISPR-associated protein Csd1